MRIEPWTLPNRFFFPAFIIFALEIPSLRLSRESVSYTEKRCRDILINLYLTKKFIRQNLIQCVLPCFVSQNFIKQLSLQFYKILTCVHDYSWIKCLKNNWDEKAEWYNSKLDLLGARYVGSYHAPATYHPLDWTQVPEPLSVPLT